MNSKTLHYSNQNIDVPALPQQGMLTGIAAKITALFVRSGIEQAQDYYRVKRERRATAPSHRDIVESLPIEDKLGLGMYRFMD